MAGGRCFLMLIGCQGVAGMVETVWLMLFAESIGLKYEIHVLVLRTDDHDFSRIGCLPMSHSSSDRTGFSSRSSQAGSRHRGISGWQLRLLIAGGIILFSIVSFYSKGQVNPVTGKKQRVDMSIKDEIVMGLQGVGSMGPPSLNQAGQLHVDRVGLRLVVALERMLGDSNVKLPYPFEFHLLAASQTVNAFALPGGQVFITEGLYRRLGNDGELAGVLGHEIGHVLERHGSQQLAKNNLLQGIVGAAGVAGGDMNSSRAAAWVGNLVKMKYGRNDELESDRWGIELMILAGYSPKHMLEVMDVLAASAGGEAPPEILSTHPRPANRQKYIDQIIGEKFPGGVPDLLE